MASSAKHSKKNNGVRLIAEDLPGYFNLGREHRLQNKRRVSFEGMMPAERKAFHDGCAHEDMALRLGDAPEVPEEYQSQATV